MEVELPFKPKVPAEALKRFEKAAKARGLTVEDWTNEILCDLYNSA